MGSQIIWTRILAEHILYGFRVGAGAFFGFEQILMGPQIMWRILAEADLVSIQTHKIETHDSLTDSRAPNNNSNNNKHNHMIGLKLLDLFQRRVPRPHYDGR